MLKLKRAYAIVLPLLMILNCFFSVYAENVTGEDYEYEQTLQTEQTTKDVHISNRGGVASDGEAEGYRQDIIDDINNNPIDGGISNDSEMQLFQTEFSEMAELNDNEVDSASDSVVVEEPAETAPDEIVETNSEIALMNTTSAIPVEFEVEPVSAPFNAYNNSNESVSLATGALNFEKNLISLPGRNGLDLNISVKYNSEDAVVTENEFDDDSAIRTSNYNQFAIGWSFGFTTIMKAKNQYGYSKDVNIIFADGASYKIMNDYDNLTTDITLKLQNYLLNDFTLVRKADSKEYVLTYSNGIKEYFDGTYGSITKREDRFGNVITFEYEDIDYFRGSFLDYIFNPSFYTSTLHALSKITDSSGRVIDINYTVNRTNNGKKVAKIQFEIGDTIYATLNLNRVKSYNGEIDILTDIVDAEGLYTRFEYDEKLAYIYNQNINGTSPTYSVNGSTFAMTKIVYPTGGYTTYGYTKERRSYCYYIPNVVFADWYDVYKVSRRFDSSSDEIIYEYEGDRSGYPYSHLRTDVYSDPNGYIYDSSVKYHTIVKHNGLTTIHTFNYQHNKISEQTYDVASSINSYMGSKGDAAWNVVVNNRIYRLDISDKSLYIYTQPEYTNEPTFLEPCNLDKTITISNVKTKDDNIYVFYRLGGGTTSSPYIYCAKVYDTSTNKWSDGGEFTLPSEYTDMSYLNMKTMYYSGGIFYSYYMKKSTYDDDYIYHITYDLSESVENRWSIHSAIMNISNSYAFSHICSNSGEIYYKCSTSIYKYNLTTDEVSSKSFSKLDKYDSVKGFVINNKTYMYTYEFLYEFNFETGTVVNAYSYPFTVNYNDTLQKGTDGNMYYFNTYNNDGDYLYIYRFNPNNKEPWTLVSYRLFDNKSFNVIMGNNTAYLTLGQSSGLSTSTDIPEKNKGGFEKINLSIYATTKSRTRANNIYNSYNQLISQEYITFNNNEKKTIGIEKSTYVTGKNIVESVTDVLNNVTKYDYTNSTYYIPVTITSYYGTNNALVTTNELSADKKKILSSTTAYDDRNIKTTYSYSSSYPGNVVVETTIETKDSVDTVLKEKSYEYDSEGVYVTKEITNNVETNGANFELKNKFDMSVSYVYDTMGRLVSTTDSSGKTTSYTYNNNGWPLKTVYPDDTFVERSYTLSNGNNKIITSFNNLYKTVDYYDNLGRLSKHTEINDDSVEKTLKTYNYYMNKLFSVTDSNGNYVEYFYDVFDRVTDILNYDNESNIAGHQSVFYDDYDLTKTLYNSEKTKKLYYDKAGRLIKEEQDTDAGTNLTTYTYDYMDNIEKITNAMGKSITNAYNDMGQLLRVTNEIGQETLYEYDKWSNVSKAMYSGGNTISYTYDNIGRLLSSTNVLGATENYAYDNSNNLIAMKDKKGQVTTNTYDQMNRLTESNTGESSVSYRYDSLGNKLSMSDHTGKTTYSYTYNNLLSKITTPDNKSISYEYDLEGNVVKVNDYAGNTYIYTYDGVNRIDKIDDGGETLADYEYTNFGTIASVSYPEGKTTYSYDNAMRVTAQTNTLTDGSVLNNYSYVYDVVGNQIQKKDTANETELITNYAYDALNRLTSAQEPDGTLTSYTFDAGNNIMTKNITHPADYEFEFVQNGSEHSIRNISTHNFAYSYNKANQLVSAIENIAGTSDNYSGYIEILSDYSYDANGNTVKVEKSGQVDDSVTEYNYNELNQLIRYKSPDGSLTDYAYDGSGTRVSKVQNNTTKRYYWDRGYIINEATDDSIDVSNYIGTQGIFGRKSSNSDEYLLKNSHGDTTNIINNNAVVRNYDYDSYGMQKEESENDTNPFRYAGEYHDDESGLIYLRNRYYDPEVGRFISEDPIQDGLNWYAYCGNNPVNFVDPWGLEITSKEENRETVEFLLSELSGYSLEFGYTDNQFYVSKVYDTNNHVGQTLVLDLINSPEVVNINIGMDCEGNTNTKWPASSDPNGIIQVYVDPYDTLGNGTLYTYVKDSQGDVVEEAFPDFILLGHELIHAWREINGLFDYNVELGQIPYDKEKIWPAEEIKTMGINYTNTEGDIMQNYETYRGIISENGLRIENFLNIRISYEGWWVN